MSCLVFFFFFFLENKSFHINENIPCNSRVVLLINCGPTSNLPSLSTWQSSTISSDLALPLFFPLDLCCQLSFAPSVFLYFLYLRCFSDQSQQTPHFLLFLLPIHLPVLLPIIPSHLPLLLGPISGGEIQQRLWILQFYCFCVRSLLHRELTQPASK